jgi:prepilin-type N-terminal cleavage/methylation domain-containing protein
MRRQGRYGFTLIETLAVLALLAIMTAAVAASLGGARRAADLDGVAERFIEFDRGTREVAKRLARPSELRFELNRGTVSRLDGGEKHPTPFVFGADVRAARLIVRGESMGYGDVAVPFSEHAHSPSYAVLLAGNAGQRWVAFAGLTGQALVLRDEHQVQDILSPPAGARADAR